jgi:hypothetical protein
MAGGNPLKTSIPGRQLPLVELPPTLAVESDECQRWVERQVVYRHISDPFSTRGCEVAAIEHRDAKGFADRHHYLRTSPIAIHNLGFFRFGNLMGIATFGASANQSALTAVFPRLTPYDESVVLLRFALLDELGGNAESWFLGQSFGHLRRAGVLGVLTYADPQPRTTLSGEVVFTGHRGIIYQSTNSTHIARVESRTVLLLPDGSTCDWRALRKIARTATRGQYLEDRLVGFGATPRYPDEPRLDWLQHAIVEARIRIARHPGNYRYAWNLADRRGRDALRAQPALEARPYPKVIAPIPITRLARPADAAFARSA